MHSIIFFMRRIVLPKACFYHCISLFLVLQTTVLLYCNQLWQLLESVCLYCFVMLLTYHWFCVFISCFPCMVVIWYYLIIVNIATFVLFGIDKRRAVTQQRRISEKKLLTMSVLGWFFGAFVGMSLFRHKTIKSWFLWKFRLIVLLWILLLGRLLMLGYSVH